MLPYNDIWYILKRSIEFWSNIINIKSIRMIFVIIISQLLINISHAAIIRFHFTAPLTQELTFRLQQNSAPQNWQVEFRAPVGATTFDINTRDIRDLLNNPLIGTGLHLTVMPTHDRCEIHFQLAFSIDVVDETARISVTSVHSLSVDADEWTVDFMPEAPTYVDTSLVDVSNLDDSASSQKNKTCAIL